MTLTNKRLWLPVIAVVTLLMGLFRGGRNSLWDDEGFSVAAAHLHIGSLLTFTSDRDPHTGAYHLLLHFWMAINGDGEAWIRALSALFLAAAAVTLWLLLLKVVDLPVALGGTALFALNGFSAAYAQDARPYTFTMFFTCLAMYFLVSAVQSGRTRYWVGWSIAGAVSIYGHPLAAVALVAAHISLLFTPRRPSIGKWMAVVVFQAVLVVPLAIMLATQTVPHLFWAPKFGLTNVAAAAFNVTGRGGPGMTVLVGLLVLISLGKAIQQRLPWEKVLLLLWALLLPVTVIALSPFFHILVGRYLAPSVPAVMAVTALAIYEFRDRMFRVGSAALMAVFALTSVNTHLTHGAKDDWRSAAAAVYQQAQPGDAIIISYEQRNVFQYYFDRYGARPTSPPVPLSPARPWGSRIPIHENYIDESSAGAVAKSAAPYKRVWSLYLDDEPTDNTLLQGLTGVYRNAKQERFEPRVMATLYSN